MTCVVFTDGFIAYSPQSRDVAGPDAVEYFFRPQYGRNPVRNFATFREIHRDTLPTNDVKLVTRGRPDDVTVKRH